MITNSNKPYVNFTLSHFLTYVLFTTLLLSAACSEQVGNQYSNKEDQLFRLKEKPDNRFTLPSANEPIIFPEAHFPKLQYHHEWWYLNANLKTKNGEAMALQWTLFRTAIGEHHLYFAHAAMADKFTHSSAFRLGRKELGNVVISNNTKKNSHTSSTSFYAQIDDWVWQSSQQFLPANLSFGSDATPSNTKWSASLSLNTNTRTELNPDRPFYFLQGVNGFNKKHAVENIASYYYSQPFINVTGHIEWKGEERIVTGKAWFDREWGSRLLAEDQQGWNWFSLRLSENKALMVYRLRSNISDYIYGSIMHSNGKIEVLETSDIHIKTMHSTHNKSTTHAYPQQFSIILPNHKINVDISVVNPQQIMRFGIAYFEGMVQFSGSHQGEGFVEMTGY